MDSLESSAFSFQPRTGSMEAWNAAYVRIEDYLRAHRIHNRLHQSSLIQAVLERAAQRHANNTSLDPTTLAAEEIEVMMDHWFADVLAINNRDHQRMAIDGRVAMLLSDGPQKWPYAFLDQGNIPVDFSASMRASSIKAGPDMTVSSMVPRDIDLGLITEAAGETLEQMEKWPLLRLFLLWAFFLGSLLGIFLATRTH
jgi:hypothetical protein